MTMSTPHRVSIIVIQVFNLVISFKRKKLRPAAKIGAVARAVRTTVTDVSTTANYNSNKWKLNGHKTVVFGAGQSDYILVSARSSGERYDKDGISIFCIDTKKDDVYIKDYPTIDGFRAAEIKLKDLNLQDSALISKKGKASDIIENTFLISLVAAAAEASGIMEKMYEMTLEYISTRKQFGKTIGSFQTIQHRAVDMLILSEEMTSLSSLAAISNNNSLISKKSIFASKINIGLGGKKLGQEAIQLHGGMGVTEEMEIGQYFKRLTLLDTFLGNSDYYLQEYSKV